MLEGVRGFLRGLVRRTVLERRRSEDIFRCLEDLEDGLSLRDFAEHVLQWVCVIQQQVWGGQEGLCNATAGMGRPGGSVLIPVKSGS
jgi:hypothetical protein